MATRKFLEAGRRLKPGVSTDAGISQKLQAGYTRGRSGSRRRLIQPQPILGRWPGALSAGPRIGPASGRSCWRQADNTGPARGGRPITVRITTGAVLVRLLVRIARSTSRPSSLGNFRLSRIRRGGAAPLRLRNPPRPKRKSSASSPSRATAISGSLSSSRSGRTVSSTSSGLSSTTRMSVASGAERRWGCGEVMASRKGGQAGAHLHFPLPRCPTAPVPNVM